MADEAFDPVSAGAVAVDESFNPEEHGAVAIDQERSIPSKIGHAVLDTLKGFLPQSVEDVALSPVTMFPGAGQAYKFLSNVAFGREPSEGISPLQGIPVVQRIPEIIQAEKTPALSQERFTTGAGVVADIGMLAGFKGALRGAKLAEVAEPLIAKAPQTATEAVQPVTTEAAASETPTVEPDLTAAQVSEHERVTTEGNKAFSEAEQLRAGAQPVPGAVATDLGKVEPVAPTEPGVIDVNGKFKPSRSVLDSTLYHGTTKTFNDLSTGVGESSGHPSSGLGIFLAEHPDQAELFTKDKTNEKPFQNFQELPYAEGANVRPVNAELKNPKIMTRREFTDLFTDEKYNQRTHEGFLKIREDLQRQGHDGIIVQPEPSYYKGSGLEEFLGHTVIAFDPKSVKPSIASPVSEAPVSTTAPLSTTTPEEVIQNATQERQITESNIAEHPGDAEVGTPAETSGSGSNVAGAQIVGQEGQVEPAVPQPEQVPAGTTPKLEVTPIVSDQPHVSTIANRFTEERAKSGELGEIAPGQGYSTKDMAAQGLKMTPEQINQHVSDLMQDTGNPVEQGKAVRAEEARLSQRSIEASRAAAVDPSNVNAKIAADDAFKDVTDFHNGPVAKLKTIFHATGIGLQGELPVDLSTFNGLRESYLREVGKAPPVELEPKLRQMADKVSTAVAEDNGAKAKLGQAIERASRGKLPTADEVRQSIIDRMKVEPCRV